MVKKTEKTNINIGNLIEQLLHDLSFTQCSYRKDQKTLEKKYNAKAITKYISSKKELNFNTIYEPYRNIEKSISGGKELFCTDYMEMELKRCLNEKITNIWNFIAKASWYFISNDKYPKGRTINDTSQFNQELRVINQRLYFAILSNNIDLAKFFLKEFYNTKILFDNNETILHILSRVFMQTNSETLFKLIEFILDLNKVFTSSNFSFTSLHNYCLFLNLKNKNNQTALTQTLTLFDVTAEKYRSAFKRILDLFIKCPYYNLNQSNLKNGQTMVHYLVENLYIDELMYAADHGRCKFFVSDKNDKTPLDIAIDNATNKINEEAQDMFELVIECCREEDVQTKMLNEEDELFIKSL